MQTPRTSFLVQWNLVRESAVSSANKRTLLMFGTDASESGLTTVLISLLSFSPVPFFCLWFYLSVWMSMCPAFWVPLCSRFACLLFSPDGMGSVSLGEKNTSQQKLFKRTKKKTTTLLCLKFTRPFVFSCSTSIWHCTYTVRTLHFGEEYVVNLAFWI